MIASASSPSKLTPSNTGPQLCRLLSPAMIIPCFSTAEYGDAFSLFILRLPEGAAKADAVEYLEKEGAAKAERVPAA